MDRHARRIYEYFGIGGLDFRLTRESRDRIMWVSLLPFLLLCALLTSLSLDLYFGDTIPTTGLNAPPEAWARIWGASDAASNVLPEISLAVLILSAISRWGRSEASWMLTIGLLLLLAAIAAAAAAIAIPAIELKYEDRTDLRYYRWYQWAVDFGLVAAGYMFVAYRGLGTAQRHRARLEPSPGPNSDTLPE